MKKKVKKTKENYRYYIVLLWTILICSGVLLLLSWAASEIGILSDMPYSLVYIILLFNLAVIPVLIIKIQKNKAISRRNKEGKHAALELSISTIVVLVIGMAMLILALVLVRTIFTGAKYNVETMNKKVEAEINKLFVEDQRAVLYLPNRIAEVKQGDEFGLGWGIQNSIATQKFKWQVEVSDDNLRKKCGITERQAEEWITTGGSGSVDVASGQKYYDVIRFNIPEATVSDISTCIIRYKLVIKQEDGKPYTTEPFDVDVN